MGDVQFFLPSADNDQTPVHSFMSHESSDRWVSAGASVTRIQGHCDPVRRGISKHGCVGSQVISRLPGGYDCKERGKGLHEVCGENGL